MKPASFTNQDVTRESDRKSRREGLKRLKRSLSSTKHHQEFHGDDVLLPDPLSFKTEAVKKKKIKKKQLKI